MDVLNVFKEYLKEHNLVANRDKVLLGVSGGPDSITMLDLFARIQDQYNLKLHVFHLNHMFRENADRDASYVKRICQKYQVPVILEKFNVPVYMQENNLSPEEAAREIRLKMMFKSARKLGLAKIALAHNQDDLVETILFNMFRGTGVKGLTGISPVTKFGEVDIIHPLLCLERKSIEEYCQKYNLNPRVDYTNNLTVYTRNKIRHHIIPYIQEHINPGLNNVMVRMADIIREESEFLVEYAREEMEKIILPGRKNEIVLDLNNFNKLHKVVRRIIIKDVIARLKGDIQDYYFKHYQLIQDFIKTGSSGKQIDLPGDIIIQLVYNKIKIFTGKNQELPGFFCIELKIPGQVKLPDGSKIKTCNTDKTSDWLIEARKKDICLIDKAKVALPLTVRNRQSGDRMQPLGMQGTKKLKDIFIDNKISPVKREQIPIIIDANNTVIWVAGIRMSENARVTEQTKDIIKIIYKQGR